MTSGWKISSQIITATVRLKKSSTSWVNDTYCPMEYFHEFKIWTENCQNHLVLIIYSQHSMFTRYSIQQISHTKIVNGAAITDQSHM